MPTFSIPQWFLPILGSALGLGFYDICKKHAVRDNSVMPVLFFATLTGSLTGWRLGTAGALNRFGQGLGKQQDSWARGMLGSPMAYYQADPLIVTAEGGTFTGGRISLAVHWLEMRLPN